MRCTDPSESERSIVFLLSQEFLSRTPLSVRQPSIRQSQYRTTRRGPMSNHTSGEGTARSRSRSTSGGNRSDEAIDPKETPEKHDNHVQGSGSPRKGKGNTSKWRGKLPSIIAGPIQGRSLLALLSSRPSKIEAAHRHTTRTLPRNRDPTRCCSLTVDNIDLSRETALFPHDAPSSIYGPNLPTFITEASRRSKWQNLSLIHI